MALSLDRLLVDVLHEERLEALNRHESIHYGRAVKPAERAVPDGHQTVFLGG